MRRELEPLENSALWFIVQTIYALPREDRETRRSANGGEERMYTHTSIIMNTRLYLGPCVCSGTKRSTRESSQIHGYVCPNTKKRTKKSVRLGSGLVANLSRGLGITSALTTGRATTAVGSSAL